MAMFLLAFLVGCKRSEIPLPVQPDEYAVYHSLLLRYAAKNPETRDHFYVYGVTMEPFWLDEKEGTHTAFLQRCMPQEAITAFRKIGHNRLDRLDDMTLNGWRILPDGSIVAFFPHNDASIPKRYKAIFFSRVFFDPSHGNAYVYERVNSCETDCGGGGTFFHGIRTTEGAWTFVPTDCGDIS